MGIADDIQVFGTDDSHDLHLHEAVERTRNVDSHEGAFQKLKDSISSDMCLQYFDTTKPATLQVDASKVFLGVV